MTFEMNYPYSSALLVVLVSESESRNLNKAKVIIPQKNASKFGHNREYHHDILAKCDPSNVGS